MSTPRFRLAAVAALAVCLLPPGTAAAQDASEDAVVARINDSEIRMSDVELAFQSLPAQYRQLPLPMIYGALLQQLVDRKLVAQAAEEQKLGEEPDVRRRLAQARESVLQQVYLSRKIDPQITEEKLRDRYDRDIAGKPGPEEVSARHILVRTEEEAEEVAEALRQGADFAEQAKAKSIDPAGQNGGDLGYFQAEDMVPEFSEAAFGLEKGETSGPVQTQYGWHIIRVDDRRTQPAPSFEESVDDLRQTVAQEIVAAVMQDLRDKADVETFAPGGTPEVTPGAPAPKQ